MPTYNSLEEMLLATAESIRPPERVTVSEAAERYHIVKNPGQHEGPFSLDKTPYLREPMDVLTSLEYRYMVFAGPARTGKALAIDTPIATPEGWTTMGELWVGSRVFDDQGHICKVTAATDVMEQRNCFRVTFSDGASIIADAEHQWEVDDAHADINRTRVLTTAQMFPKHKYGKNQRNRYSIRIAKPLVLRERPLPIDPYVFGVWLGDGASSSPRITSGDQDVEDMVANIRAVGVECNFVKHSGGKANTIYLRPDGAKKRRGCWSLISRRLYEIGMGRTGCEKFIPTDYLRASISQRFALLQGLMDTDGHVDPRGGMEFCTTSEKIAEGFCELLSSLGYKYGVTKRPAARKIAHRINFMVMPGDTIFRLPRKQSVLDIAAKRRCVEQNRKRYIVSIEPVPSVPVRCITVDSPSHLFLAGRQMIPTHNSSMAVNWLCHTAITDPADIMVINMTQHAARDWSQADLAKAIRNSPELKKRLTPGRQNDNVYDKHFLSGMRLLVTWPTISNLSGKTIPRLWLLDYDRMPLDVDGEGTPFDLAAKRMTTFRRYGMCAAEASPGYDIEDPKWMANDQHEAPPTKGILSLYNRGDRRRWYWACPQCESAFQPQFKHLHWPNLDSKDIMEMAEQTVMVCPHCGGYMEPRMQRELNRGGRWVKSGQIWHPATDEITGQARRSDMASFWMFGPAAGFTDWPELVKKYLNALQDYEQTGDEGPLRTTTNVDQGEPYLPKLLEGARLPETLKARAEDWGGHNEHGEPYVPDRVRFLVATIDVQAGGRPSFVVHVFGVAEGFDIYHVEMFKITKSARVNDIGERESLDPAAHPEDWDLLIEQVLDKSYPLNDDSGRRMSIKITACDSGGADGVTANAYEFYRSLRASGRADRFHLVKGSPSRTETAPIRVSWPNSQQKDRFAIARGDVPVWLVNSNIVKDQASNMLGRDEPGGMIHFPRWAQDWLYSQLTTEIRDPQKGWINPSRRRNEAFDLLAYCIAICDHPDVRIRFIDWSNPPVWADNWDNNPLVFGGTKAVVETVSVKLEEQIPDSLEELGSLLA